MTEPLQQDGSHEPADLAKECWDRVLEIYKARLTINTALAVATVTLTGYGLQTGRRMPIIVAAMIPVLAFVCDSLIKWRYATPFLYKLVATECKRRSPEPLSILFLDFVLAEKSLYAQLGAKVPSEQRRIDFRKRYVITGLWVRMSFYFGIAVIEVVLAVLIGRL